MRGKTRALAGIVSAISLAGGCADFNAKIPVPGFALRSEQSVKIDFIGSTLILKYIAPEAGDGERDDKAELLCYGPFEWFDEQEFKLGTSGRFYGCGVLFDYDIENDNDSNPYNNVLLFSAQAW